MTAANAVSHVWRFFRAGGFDQVRLESGADLKALASLDQKLWVALSCPTRGVEFDVRTLDLIDSDHDGRIRAGEILTAVSWALDRLSDPEVLLKEGDSLPLSAIDASRPEGARILASAKRILANMGRKDADSISPDDTMDTERIFAQTRFNGDGVLPPEATDDEEVAGFIRAIMDLCGSQPDRSGAPGITREAFDRFSTEVQAFADWWKQSRTDAAILPLGEATIAAHAAFLAVRDKIEDYVTRCHLAAYDSRAEGALNRSEADYVALAGHLLSATADEVGEFPLARVAALRSLPLAEGVNPAWTERMQTFSDLVVTPLLGKTGELDFLGWKKIKDAFAPFDSWLAAKQGGLVESLQIERINAYLDHGVADKISALIAQDEAVEAEADAIAEVDRLVRYRRDLLTLLNNFISFRDFYTGHKRAIFQIGTLYLDGRSCDLVVRADDPEKHAKLATLSRICLVYCDCVRPASDERMTIAAAFTAGDADQIVVGRNGLFYDQRGRDWEATVVKIIDHPISLRQAFWMPYRKVGQTISAQIEKAAAARAAAQQQRVVVVSSNPLAGAKPASAPTPAAAPAAGAPAPAPAPGGFDAGRFAGIFAAIGLAIGAIGTAIASVVSSFLSLSWWQMPLALIGVVALFSGPSILIAFMKLRQRNLGPILDANGWAVNSRAKINIPFGTSLTHLAKLPEGSERALSDPYAEKQPPWKLYLVLGFVAAGLVGLWFAGGGDWLRHFLKI
ncbi:MAG: hypothetical protein HQL45_05860 [Alphaproteobacteria bacterium]|nr:hypothetical protein [Alphaproteobacteria bacterium]